MTRRAHEPGAVPPGLDADRPLGDGTAPLSQPWSEWLRQRAADDGPIPLDAVVVGSGYGGSVAALRLREQGWRVTVLERGGEYLPGDFPNDLSTVPEHLRAPSVDGRGVAGRANGLFELRAGPGLIGLVANGVGGGSLVNAGVLVAPDEDVFAQPAWPAAIRHDPAALSRHLQRARQALGAHSADSFSGLPKAKALHRLGQALRPGCDSAPVEFTIDPAKCLRCGDCASGCNVDGAKITLRHSLLGQAHRQGVRILNSATVYALSRGEQGVGWRLRVLPTESVQHYRCLSEAALDARHGGVGVDVDARLVVLAAGTFGSTELLQRSREREGQRLWLSPALGTRLSGNGDSLSFSLDEPQPVRAIGVGADAGSCEAHETQAERPGDGAPDLRVGPTITRMLDLRRRPSSSSVGVAAPRPALEDRLLIEEGAVPGAIAAVFAEMIATADVGTQLAHWRWQAPRGRGREPLSAGAGRSQVGRTDRIDASAPPQRVQVLLTMGHDGAAGRIVWVPGRDSSAPVWESPETLATYRRQEALLAEACRRIGGRWVPHPAWQLLPPAVTGLLSGPKPPRFITTVHPLGGCPMGDDPRTSVVDALGRVWAAEEGTERLHRDLYVLDGSIVPTSLGCNPLLTIAALAERAMSQDVPLPPPDTAERDDAGVPASSAGGRHSDPPAPPPRPLSRRTPPVLPVNLEERLVCESLAWRKPWARRWGSSGGAADIELTLQATDWHRLWDDPLHRLVPAGRLRLDPTRDGPGHDGSAPVVYETFAGGQAVAELLSYGGLPDAWRWVDPLPGALRLPLRAAELGVRVLMLCALGRLHPLRAALTWMVLRGWPDARHRSPEERARPALERWRERPRQLLEGAKGLLHACEQRRMRYRIDFRLASAPSHIARRDLPRVIRLSGEKHIDYAATWGALLRWSAGAVASGLLRRPLPALERPSFFAQMTRLQVTLRDERGRRLAAPAAFPMDLAHLVERLPLRLPSGGDLPSAMAAMAAYPLVFGRFLMKTRLFDFRLPSRSGVPLRDDAPWRELALRTPRWSVLPREVGFEVPLGVSSSDPPDADPDRRLGLKLWHYDRPDGAPVHRRWRESRWHGRPVRKARTVLLVHAFAQSGYSYTLKSVPQNLAEALYRRGFEVWVLEHRLSTRLPAHQEQSTLDQMALHDLPRAVDEVIASLDARFGADPQRPWQIQVFAQCVGAAATMMALTGGRLSHAVDAPVAGDGLPAPRLPKLAGLVVSQTHPLCIGTPLTQAKTWLPAFLRDTMRQPLVPFAVRMPSDTIATSLMDRLFSALPVPQDETCPSREHGDHDEDDCATCRRLRFLEAPLFRHRNLSYATHRELPRLFGDSNVRLFAQMAKCVEAERLVTEDGQHSHVTDVHIHRHAALPVCFLHAGDNEVFDPESARRSARLFARVHPAWADVAKGRRPPGPATAPDPERAAWIVDGYGHVDVMIARDAHRRVFPGLVQRFNDWHLHDETATPAPVTRHATLRLPVTGPMVGAVRRDEDGRLRVSVSMRIDDRFTDGKSDPADRAGGRTGAFARWRWQGEPAFRDPQPMGLRSMVLPAALIRPRDGAPQPVVALRTAAVDLRVDDRGEVDGVTSRGLEIECFSVHETLVGAGAAVPDDALPLPAGLLEDAMVRPSASPSLSPWLDRLLALRARRIGQLERLDRPARTTVSAVSLHPERLDSRLATLGADTLTRLAPPNGQRVDRVVLAAASCRYPGFRFERQRVDRWLALAQAFHADGGEPPDAALLLGDQIYADATAGFADPLSPAERFVERHRFAFARARRGRPPAFGDWLATLPTVMVPDDHEFANGYPEGTPLAPASPARRARTQARVGRLARHAVQALQQRAAEPLRLARGVWAFDAGPARVLLLDTRSHRRQAGHPPRPHAILGRGQLQAVARWLSQADATQRLNIVATGSVVLPGLRLRGKPTDPGRPDTFQRCPPDRDALLGVLAAAGRAEPGRLRCLLLSGDYHVSVGAELQLDGRPFGACIVAPPLYSSMPFTNAEPHDLWLDEPLPHGLALVPSTPPQAPPGWRGNGLGHLTVQRLDDAQAPQRYELAFAARLWVPDQFEAPEAVTQHAWSLRI